MNCDLTPNLDRNRQIKEVLPAKHLGYCSAKLGAAYGKAEGSYHQAGAVDEHTVRSPGVVKIPKLTLTNAAAFASSFTSLVCVHISSTLAPQSNCSWL